MTPISPDEAIELSSEETQTVEDMERVIDDRLSQGYLEQGDEVEISLDDFDMTSDEVTAKVVKKIVEDYEAKSWTVEVDGDPKEGDDFEKFTFTS